MRVSDLIEALSKYPEDANARAYEGEVCGVIIESKDGEEVGVIAAHESDEYSEVVFRRRIAALRSTRG